MRLPVTRKLYVLSAALSINRKSSIDVRMQVFSSDIPHPTPFAKECDSKGVGWCLFERVRFDGS